MHQVAHLAPTAVVDGLLERVQHEVGAQRQVVRQIIRVVHTCLFCFTLLLLKQHV